MISQHTQTHGMIFKCGFMYALHELNTVYDVVSAISNAFNVMMTSHTPCPPNHSHIYTRDCTLTYSSTHYMTLHMLYWRIQLLNALMHACLHDSHEQSVSINSVTNEQTVLTILIYIYIYIYICIYTLNHVHSCRTTQYIVN